MKKDFWLIDIWEEGKYADLWSVNHFLGGAILAQLTLYLDLSFWTGLISSVFLMAIWEMYEVIAGIKESAYNKSTDIGFGVSGFLLYILFLFKLKYYKYIIFFISIVFVLLEIWGYLAYRLRIKRDKLKC